MVESMRAYGYNLATALADLIDNSIAAGSRKVWLRCEWAGSSSWISVTDDGAGMSEKELVNAMRLGSTNPTSKRAKHDLGRFGLGLKTASFSQARRLTVITKKKRGSRVLRRWDLDHLARANVTGWQLLREPHSDSLKVIKELESRRRASGTHVLLECIDRVTGGIPNSARRTTAEKHFVSEVELVRYHLGMVFHRYLAAPKNKRLSIYINESAVEAWDPFLEKHAATQSFPVDSNSDLGGRVRVEGFVLPHRDRFDEKDQEKGRREHAQAAGPAGWNAHQGFYLYRNERLIIPGDWLGLGPGSGGWKKEEHFKLARIRVDIPNSMDDAWKIDVKKSTASAPPVLREWLTGLARNVRERAKIVYAHRGGYSPRRAAREPEYSSPWLTRKVRGNHFSYRIDRNHPLFSSLMNTIPKDRQSNLMTLLRLIEETVPVQRIWIDSAENQDGLAKPFEGETDRKIRTHIENLYQALLERDISDQKIWELFSNFPAFQTKNFQSVIGELRDRGEGR
jgi:hypothetical protein